MKLRDIELWNNSLRQLFLAKAGFLFARTRSFSQSMLEALEARSHEKHSSRQNLIARWRNRDLFEMFFHFKGVLSFFLFFVKDKKLLHNGIRRLVDRFES